MPVWRIITGFLTGVMIPGLIAVLVIAVAPKAVQSWRELALAHPGRAIWPGFGVTSALAGSGFVLMLTIVGVVLLPVMLIITVFGNFRGLCAWVICAGCRAVAGRRTVLRANPGWPVLGAFVAGLAWLSIRFSTEMT